MLHPGKILMRDEYRVPGLWLYRFEHAPNYKGWMLITPRTRYRADTAIGAIKLLLFHNGEVTQKCHVRG